MSTARSEAPSYRTHDPRGWCGDPSRGAALGRQTVHDAPRDEPVKLTLRRVRLDRGGYDTIGTYFGTGSPLYWYASDDGRIDGVLRALDRATAKDAIRRVYVNARFHR
jgi:hypothetical protein